MAAPSSSTGDCVVSPQFCVPYPVELVITKRPWGLTDTDFAVSDANGAIVLKVKGKALSLKGRIVLEDAAGNTVLSFHPKALTWHQRWKAFRGNSSKSSNLLFSVKRSSVFQLKTKLHVFLAANVGENRCDFKVKGNLSQSSCTIYGGDSSRARTVLAKMEEKTSLKNGLLGKDTYRINIAPNVDYAFVIALIIILTEIDKIPDVQPPN